MENMEKKRIEERIIKLEECLSSLKKITPKTYEKYNNSGIEVRWDLERGLQLISQIEVDIIISLHKILKKAPVGEELSLLSALSKELGEGVIKSVKERRKLRNELVHAYTLDNSEQVFDQAAATEDVGRFEDAVKDLLRKIQ